MPEFVLSARRGRHPVDAARMALPDVAAARREAMRFAGELLIGDDDAFQGEEWTVTVANGSHLVLFSMHILWTAAPALGSPRGARPLYR